MDEDAPPRLRSRIVSLAIAAAIILPVLYVAAYGPLVWWEVNHVGMSPWYKNYQASLAPLYESPQIGSMLDSYNTWWANVPALRSWERAEKVRQIEVLKRNIQKAFVTERQWKEHAARVESGRKRLDVLLAQPGRDKEIAEVEAELEKEMYLAAEIDPMTPGDTPASLQWTLERFEQELRQFDAR